MRIPGPVVRALLETWPVARLATLGKDGAPHQIPIVFAQAGGGLWSPVDGKPKRDAVPQRAVNIRRDSRVSLLLDHYDRSWSRLWWIRVDAIATAQPVVPDDSAVAAAFDALLAKYPQYRETPVVSDRQLVIRIEAERISSWCPGPDAPELPA